MDHPSPAPTSPGTSRDPIGHWVPLIAGLGLIGVGVFWVVAKGSRLIGPSLICTGLILLPWPLLSVLGGVGFIGLGVYQFVVFKTVTLLGAVLVVLGGVTLADRGGKIVRRP